MKKNLVYLIILAITFTLSSFSLAQNNKIDSSISKGIDWLTSQEGFKCDELWMMGEISKNTKNIKITEFYNNKIQNAYRMPSCKYFLKLFYPDTTLEALPDKSTLSESAYWLVAAANIKDFPPDNEVLNQLFNKSYTEYNATHQLLALLWLKNQEYKNNRLDVKIKQVTRGILEEMENSPLEFSDLMIERLALITFAGYKSLIPGKWIQKVLSSQDPKGFWGTPFEVRMPNLYLRRVGEGGYHETALALWFLSMYQNDQIPEQNIMLQ